MYGQVREPVGPLSREIYTVCVDCPNPQLSVNIMQGKTLQAGRVKLFQ